MAPLNKYTTWIRTSPNSFFLTPSNTETYAMFEFSNWRFLVVGPDLGSQGCLSSNCPEPITINCAHQVPKSCTTNQPQLACSWPSDHYLSANYSPCKPTKLVPHYLVQGRSCCEIQWTLSKLISLGPAGRY